MKTLAFAVASLSVLLPTLARAAIVADSEADFPSTADQGVNGWTYGYRTVDQGADDLNTYDPEADFVAFDEADGWTWNGTGWDWGSGNTPWTTINATGGHPNGTNSGDKGEQWAVRRWTAEIGPKPLAVTWHLHKNNAAGTGTSVSINLNGVQVDYAAIEGSDQEGIDRTVYVNVNPGDHIDISLTPVGPEVNGVANRTDGSDSSSWRAVLDDAIPDNPTQPDGSPFVAVTGDDSDSDDLPDAWERLFAESLATLSGANDSDSDNLTDLQEFEAGLDPTDSDSDDDGLLDGDELAAGTNPKKVDSDGNGLTDAQELVVDAVRAAKIGDSIEDFVEAQGPAWFNGFRDYTADGGGEDYDPDAQFTAFSTDDGWTWTGNAWDWGTGNVPWTTLAAEGVHPNGANNSTEQWAIRRWVASELTEPTPLAILWNVREQNLDGGGISGSLNINGKQAVKATVAGGDEVGHTGLYFVNALPGDKIDLGLTPEGPNDGRADGSDGSLSWMVISTFIPDNARQPDGSVFIPSTGSDSDGDGLPDAWERQFFPDDLSALASGSDGDGDGLLDEDEFALSTNPTLSDTDGDGLPDGAERADGVFVNASQAGSNPLKADTDSDGLTDSEEANGNPATNPNKADSDGDGFTDPDELAAGFDPNDASKNPFAGLIANSVSEFTGTHGENGWYHGYRAVGETPEEAPVNYDPVADFVVYPDDWWTGVQWDEPNDDGDNIPWTFIGSEGGHPNGTNSGGFEEWAIRRWVADELDAPTPLGIVYHLRKTNGNGNGTTVQLHINGELKDSLAVAGSDTVGETRTFYANVNPGDFVDLALTPVGPDEGRGDGSDGSAFILRIDSAIPDNPTQPDGSTFVPVVLGDPHLSIPFRTPFGLLGDNPGVQTRTLTLSNAGSSKELTVSSVTLSGADKDHYSIDLTVPLTLAPGGSQDFTVSFDPNGSDGGFVAMLEFSSNDENEAIRRLDLSASIPDQNKLLSWYKMDETSGTRLNDASGNGNHGNYVANGGTITLGQPGLAGGTAVAFAPGGDDSAAYAEVSAFPAADAGFSISMWFQADPNSGAVAGLLSKNDSSGTAGSPYALAVNSNQLAWFGDGTPDIAGDNSPVTPNQAQHVAVVYDPADPITVKIYVDGALTETNSEASEITDLRAALQIGAVSSQFGFQGRIDDVQVYGRSLGLDDVSELFANPGQKLGSGGGPDPEPDSDFRNSLTTLEKTDAGIRVRANLEAGATYDVEYSEDLIDWETIGSGVSVSPFEDAEAGRTSKPTGYYRVKQ